MLSPSIPAWLPTSSPLGLCSAVTFSQRSALSFHPNLQSHSTSQQHPHLRLPYSTFSTIWIPFTCTTYSFIYNAYQDRNQDKESEALSLAPTTSLFQITNILMHCLKKAKLMQKKSMIGKIATFKQNRVQQGCAEPHWSSQPKEKWAAIHVFFEWLTVLILIRKYHSWRVCFH